MKLSFKLNSLHILVPLGTFIILTISMLTGSYLLLHLSYPHEKISEKKDRPS